MHHFVAANPIIKLCRPKVISPALNARTQQKITIVPGPARGLVVELLGSEAKLVALEQVSSTMTCF